MAWILAKIVSIIFSLLIILRHYRQPHQLFAIDEANIGGWLLFCDNTPLGHSVKNNIRNRSPQPY